MAIGGGAIYPQHPLGPPGQPPLRRLGLSEEGGEPFVPGRLGVGGVPPAGVGPPQGVLEHAYEVEVLVPGPRGPPGGRVGFSGRPLCLDYDP